MKHVRFICLFCALSSLLLLICGCSSGKAKIPEPDDVFYVYDEAGIIDDELKNYIVSKNVSLCEQCGGQIVVAAVKTTGSKSIEKYAYELFNDWGIGDSEKNNGMLLLISVEEDDYWALQGKGLEKLIQSGTLKLMLNDHLEPFFAKKQYGEGIRMFFDALVDRYEQIYSITVTQSGTVSVPSTPEQTETQQQTGTSFFSLVKSFIAFIAFIIVTFTVIVMIVIAAIIVFIIIASLISAGSSTASFHAAAPRTVINPYSFKPSGTTFHTSGRTGGFSSGRTGGFSSGRTGGFSSGRSGGFSSGGHHSGGGGGSRGGGAGRR
ncbi:MAG: TPM domain-containing protein [Clostridia bacterium]|nr:TPM domain-containing protein [Clostridia bacterium]